jgi:hypothetical protein
MSPVTFHQFPSTGENCQVSSNTIPEEFAPPNKTTSKEFALDAFTKRAMAAPYRPAGVAGWGNEGAGDEAERSVGLLLDGILEVEQVPPAPDRVQSIGSPPAGPSPRAKVDSASSRVTEVAPGVVAEGGSRAVRPVMDGEVSFGRELLDKAIRQTARSEITMTVQLLL